MTCGEAALAYLDMGLHPIPCRPKSKVPLVKWQPFQTSAPTRDQVGTWWRDTPDANVALVLGRGTFAVDLDGGDDADALLRSAGVTLPVDAPRSRTASGYHVFLSSYNAIPDRVGLLSTDGHKPQVDIRGVGIVIAPPSIHPTGARYEWEIPITAARPPKAPDALEGLIAQHRETPPATPDGAATVTSWVRDALRGVGEGQRDATCTRLAGFFLKKGLDPDVTVTLLTETFGRACQPSFSERDVRKCVLSIARREGAAGHDPVASAAPLERVLGDLLKVLEAGSPITIKTPFALLDYFLNGGWSPGELIYIGARPGMGKTALGLLCAKAAAGHQRSVLIVSREMTNLALARRMVAQDGRVNASSLKRAALTESELHRVGTAVSRLANLPIWLTDQVITLEQLNHLMSESRHLGLVVVDYLQLLRAPASIKERRHQVEYVSAGLKTLALEYQVPIICLSSLSRPQDKDRPRRPTLADLRESGELEHDADVILMLHRPDPAQPEVECLVQKNREGQLGTVRLRFDAEFVSFSQLDERA